MLLEILKYKIIDQLNSNINNIILKNDFEENFEKLYERSILLHPKAMFE